MSVSAIPDVASAAITGTLCGPSDLALELLMQGPPDSDLSDYSDVCYEHTGVPIA